MSSFTILLSTVHKNISAAVMSGFAENSNVVDLYNSLLSLRHLFTKIRDVETSSISFKTYARRLMTLICEEGLARVSPEEIIVTTPTNLVFKGEVIDASNITAVSIIRAGDSMLEAFMGIAPEASVGKILIQRDEETSLPILFYSKLPPSISQNKVVLLDPMLATGGSAKCAIKVLLEKGIPEDNIYFFNVISCPEGIASLTTAFPRVKIITGCIDDGLNEKNYIVPGLGDYGDRYFGTTG